MKASKCRLKESSHLLLWRWLLFSVVLWLGGCGLEPVPPLLEVEYAGCAEVLVGSGCLPTAERELRLWVLTSADAQLQLRTGNDAEVPVHDVVDVEGGRRLTAVLPEGATELIVRARIDSGESLWQLPIAEHNNLRQGDLSLVAQAAEMAAAGYEATRRGEFDLASEYLTAAQVAYATSGRQLTEVMTAASVVFCQSQQRHFTAARAVLESLHLDALAPAEARFQKSFYQGVVAMAAGDSRTALRALTDAGSRAQRLGMRRELGMSKEALGLHLSQLGRAGEAAEVFARLRAEEDYGEGSVDRARLLSNHAWTLLLAYEAGEGVGDPLPLLEDARRSFDAKADLIDQQVNVRLSLALAYLHADRLQEAEVMLAEAAELTAEPPVHLRLWWLDIEARVALGRGHHDAALLLYSRLDRLARSAFDPEGRWRAAVGRARAQMAQGMTTTALSALAEAEALLDQQSLLIPLDQGRETFMAQRGESVRLYLDLLLGDGQIVEAFAAARRSRSRTLRTLRYQDRLGDLAATEREHWEQAVAEYRQLRSELDAALSDDWELSAEELVWAHASRAALSDKIVHVLDHAFAVFGPDTATTPLPQPQTGELTLAYHPLPRGWVAFAATGEEVNAHRFELPAKDSKASPGELAAALLAPFHEEVLAAERIRILPYGELQEVDFHALPFHEDVLLAAKPVVYGLDLVTVREAAVSELRRALVVADPRSDLSAARSEAGKVHEALTEARPAWRVEVLEGNTATTSSVSHWLGQVDLLHYAGHGVFSGRGGWESSLPLAGDTKLTLGDLLALERSPRWVVLSGCETARVASPGVESLGLAHGFLLAGSKQVVAAVRPVGDRAAEELFEGFYRDMDGTPDLVLRLQQAQLAWRRRGGGDWASFRVLEP